MEGSHTPSNRLKVRAWIQRLGTKEPLAFSGQGMKEDNGEIKKKTIYPFLILSNPCLSNTRVYHFLTVANLPSSHTPIVTPSLICLTPHAQYSLALDIFNL